MISWSLGKPNPDLTKYIWKKTSFYRGKKVSEKIINTLISYPIPI